MTSSLKRPAHRPRTVVDEAAIRQAHNRGVSITAIAQLHATTRDIVRRVLNDEPEPVSDSGRKARVIPFNSTYAPVAPPGHVTSVELFERSGITYRQLDHWARTGLLRIHGERLPGSGNARFYPEGEIAVIRQVHPLLDDGVPPRAAFRIARELLEHGHSSIGGIRLDLPQEV